VRAASADERDRSAATFADLLANRIFFDPLLRGSLPAELIERTKSVTDWDFVQDGDLQMINAPLDVLGINYYFPQLVGATPQPGEARSVYPGASDIYNWQPQGGPTTGLGWPVEPASMTELLVNLNRDYPGVPFVITENGAAYPDTVSASGEVDDPNRVAYLASHIESVRQAIEKGVDVRGYYVWSLLDNFEWGEGYSQRFGIVHVDFADQQRRRRKRSFDLYRRVVAANGVPDDVPVGGPE
jgi:beta-glucosidase